MSDVPEVPRRRWWIWLPAGCLGFLVVMFALGSLVVSGRASSRWKDFVEKNAALRARVLSQPAEREPLEPPKTDGNAWDLYLAAATALSRMKSDEASAIDEVRSGKFTPEAQKKAYGALDAHAADIDALRRAAHASSWQDGMKWDMGWSAPMEWLGPFRQAGRTMELSARRRRQAGDIDGAIDDLAAVTQLSVDCASTGPVICSLVGYALLTNVAPESASVLSEPGLTAVQAARIERLFSRAEAALRPLDRQLEADHVLINESMLAIAEGRASLDDLGFPAAARLYAWRHGFSWRIVAADLDEVCTRTTEECRPLPGMPWGQAAAVHDRLQQAAARDEFLGLLLSSTLAIDRCGRSVRARLRLLQALAHERATGQPMAPMPDDPFTIAPLHRLDAAGTLRLWSEWTDGDQAGAGAFADDPATSGDIVLEWKR